ncbi:MAG: PorP/SprF family type IX secretion system membrane protein [Bacteroidia bacterium]|nr:PorP/SprF family type IX secretion system membrane protein [Bacteroidia bacterium]
MKLRLIKTGIMVILAGNLSAQDLHFSQFYMAPLQQNPALAGAVHELQAVLHYREQWRSVFEPYTTIAASLDMRLNKRRVKSGYWAAGLSFISDKAGSARLGTTQGDLSLAYHLKVNRYHLLGLGLRGAFAQWGFIPGALQWGNQYQAGSFNASLPTGETLAGSTTNFFDIGAGFNWTFNNTSGTRMVTDNHDQRFVAGFAFYHPIRPSVGVIEGEGNRLYMRTTVYANGLFSIANSDFALAPGFFLYNQGPARQIYLGTLVRYKFRQESKYTGFEKGAAVSVGAYMRAADGVSASILLEMARYAIGFSYDFNTSTFSKATGTRGALELSLRFVNPNPFYNTASRSRI